MDILTSIGTTMNTLSSSFLGKCGILASSAAIAFFTPIYGLLFACFALNAADLVTGLHVAIKQGKHLTSRKTWKGTITKVEQESALIVLLHVIEHFAMASFGATTMLSGGATTLICLTEVWSIIENMNTINPDGPWRVLKAFLKHKGEELIGVDIYDNTGDSLLDSKA